MTTTRITRFLVSIFILFSISFSHSHAWSGLFASV